MCSASLLRKRPFVFGGRPVSSSRGRVWRGSTEAPAGFRCISSIPGTATHKGSFVSRRLQHALEERVASCPELQRSWITAINEYSPADTSQEAEWSSFCIQLNEAAERRKTIEAPNEAEIEAVTTVLEDLYKTAMCKPVSSLWNSRQNFEQLLMTLDNSSAPGYPYQREAPTIGDWLKIVDGMPNIVQVERLWYDVQLVMRGEYDHIFRAFVKDEPHKASKVKAGKWRLIIASSLPVQMVWRMLYFSQNEALNASSSTIPSKHGFVFCYGGWRRFLAMAKTKGITISRDISAWDVNAPGWVFKVVGRLRARWSGVDDEWRRVHNMLYTDAYEDSRILFSNGLIVKQLFQGFMKSGLFNTITDNSMAMVAMHILACLRSNSIIGQIFATGDDVVQEVCSDEYLSVLEKLGCRVKELINHIEFMGLSFRTGKPEPLYVAKHMVNFMCKEGLEKEVLDSYCRNYAESEYFDFWHGLAKSLGIQLPSRSYYRFWMSSPLAQHVAAARLMM
nr:RNA-dependent RNA polymerase [Humaita-Tubiacanga virus]QEM39315.1 RNA-dependent RNA polymerase [Humaita-Tubiacanga virus]